MRWRWRSCFYFWHRLEQFQASKYSPLDGSDDWYYFFFSLLSLYYGCQPTSFLRSVQLQLLRTVYFSRFLFHKFYCCLKFKHSATEGPCESVRHWTMETKCAFSHQHCVMLWGPENSSLPIKCQNPTKTRRRCSTAPLVVKHIQTCVRQNFSFFSLSPNSKYLSWSASSAASRPVHMMVEWTADLFMSVYFPERWSDWVLQQTTGGFEHIHQ